MKYLMIALVLAGCAASYDYEADRVAHQTYLESVYMCMPYIGKRCDE